MKPHIALTLLMVSTSVPAGELPLTLQAKFIKILVAGSGIVCHGADLTNELKALGIAVSPSAKFAFAANESELKAMKGKLIIVPSLDLLPKGGSIAIVEENGKPQIYLHMGNIAASGVVLSDSLLKIGKKL